VGTARLEPARAQLQDTFATYSNWSSLDLTFSPEGGEEDAVYLTNFSAVSAAAPTPAFNPFSIDLLLSFYGRNSAFSDRFEWAFETPFIVNSNSIGNIVAYDFSNAELQFFDLASGNEDPIVVAYASLP